MMSLRDKEDPFYNTKQEIGDSNKPSNSSALPSSSNSSRQWSSGFKNPRIVRVSRTFGGKDRHSKVCTIKGLRDRRIRLSVPTAIQLYDLQDRLGLSQPSKVIDWLIDNTKQDIDKLPPLPIIPGSFDPSQGYGIPISSTSSQFIDTSFMFSRKGGININSSSSAHDLDNNVDEDDQSSIVAKLKYWNTNSMMRSKEKDPDDHGSTSQVLAQNLFPIASSSTCNNNSNSNTNSNSMFPPQNPHPTYLSNNSMLNYYHLEPSNLSLTQLGSLGLPSSHGDHNQGSSRSTSTPQPSSLSLSSIPQLFLCPSMTSASFFPQNHQSSFINNVHNHNHNHHHQVDNEIRQLTRFPFSSTPYTSSFHSSNGSNMKPFHLSMNHGPHLHQSEEESRQGKSSHRPWKESSRDN